VSEEKINHPPHYLGHPSGVECIEITEHMTFNLGNAVKYIWRAGVKDPDVLTDLQKAKWYIDREILRLAKEKIDEHKESVARAKARSQVVPESPRRDDQAGDSTVSNWTKEREELHRAWEEKVARHSGRQADEDASGGGIY